MVAAVTVLGHVVFAGSAQLADVVMTYLLAIVLISLRWGLASSLCASVLAVLTLDYFFIPPFNTFAVSDVSHIPLFGVMFIVGVVISLLTKRVRDQAEVRREQRYLDQRVPVSAQRRAIACRDDLRRRGRGRLARQGPPRREDARARHGRRSIDRPRDVHAPSVDEVAEWTRQNGRPGRGRNRHPARRPAESYLPLDRSGVLAVRLARRAKGSTTRGGSTSRRLRARSRARSSARSSPIRRIPRNCASSKRAAPQFALLLGLARSPHTARRHHRRRERAPRLPTHRTKVCTEPTDTVISEAERLNRLVAQLPRHDPPRGRRRSREQGMAACRRGGRRCARARRKYRRRPSHRHRPRARTCRSCRSTRFSCNKCSSICSRMRPSTRHERHRGHRLPARLSKEDEIEMVSSPTAGSGFSTPAKRRKSSPSSIAPEQAAAAGSAIRN